MIRFDSNDKTLANIARVVEKRLKDRDVTLTLILDETIGKVILPKQYNEKFLALEETQANLIYDSIKEYFNEDYSLAGKYHIIVPIIIGCNRVATMLAARPDRAYDDEDIAICEYGATVVGL
ncbi:MAG: hypothetical protein IKV00_01440, partial [Clostridia bacterium]|nr:hypothetical protein [Clostridia bacterium]